MLIELKKEDVHIIKPILIGKRVNLEIKAIASGNNPGWVFVDDHSNPQTALVFSYGQRGFYFIGQENNMGFEAAFLATIDYIKSRLAELNIKYFEYSGTSLEWEQYLERLFAHYNYDQSTQHVYLFPHINEFQLTLHQRNRGCQVMEISSGLLNNPKIDTTYIESIILNWWESLNNFQKIGCGYGVVYDGKVVAVCFTSFIDDEKNWELGVYTLPEYRGRGHAKEATIRLLEKCRKHGVRPYWDCMETNTSSHRLAVGLGFSLAFTYKVYYFDF